MIAKAPAGLPRAVLCALAFCAALPIFSQETAFGGSLTAQAGSGVRGENKGHLLTSQTVFDGTIKSYLNESYLFVDGSATFDALGALSENKRTGYVSGDGNIALKLKEAYMDYAGEHFALRVGRQIAAWGKADGIQVADVLCPKDESVLFASEYADERLGIDAARLSFTSSAVQVDVYWIPVFTPSTLPLSPENPLKKYEFDSDIDTDTIFFNTPKLRLYNGEGAARFAAFLPFADFSLYGFYGWEDTPFLHYSDSGKVDDDGEPIIAISGEYERMIMFGADAAVPVGPVTIRLEGAVFPRRHMQASDAYQNAAIADKKSDYWTIKRTEVIGLAGFDWMPSGGWTITAQYWADYVTGSMDDLSREKAYEHQATLSIEKTLLGETLTLSGDIALDIRSLSTASEVSAEYKLSDAISLSAIGDIFLKGKKNKDGMYGGYKDLTCVTLRGKYTF